MSMTDQAEPLVMFVIYDHPKDMPDFFVARRWFVLKGKEEPIADGLVFYAEELAALREMLPPGLVMLARCDGDDPTILETWL